MRLYEVFQFLCECGESLETDAEKRATCRVCGHKYEIAWNIFTQVRRVENVEQINK